MSPNQDGEHDNANQDGEHDNANQLMIQQKSSAQDLVIDSVVARGNSCVLLSSEVATFLERCAYQIVYVC
jgi:hypothetical protein